MIDAAHRRARATRCFCGPGDPWREASNRRAALVPEAGDFVVFRWRSIGRARLRVVEGHRRAVLKVQAGLKVINCLIAHSAERHAERLLGWLGT